jgi:hypothetical protein
MLKPEFKKYLINVSYDIKKIISEKKVRYIHAREAEINGEVEILDDKKLFFMARNNFTEKINLMKGKKSLRRESDAYIINGF